MTVFTDVHRLKRVCISMQTLKEFHIALILSQNCIKKSVQNTNYHYTISSRNIQTLKQKQMYKKIKTTSPDTGPF